MLDRRAAGSNPAAPTLEKAEKTSGVSKKSIVFQ
jgi:hypothetical protein